MQSSCIAYRGCNGCPDRCRSRYRARLPVGLAQGRRRRDPQARPHGGATGPDETPEQEASQLRARVRELEAESVKLNTERDILRAAAKYFAGETNWSAASSSSPTTPTPSR